MFKALHLSDLVPSSVNYSLLTAVLDLYACCVSLRSELPSPSAAVFHIRCCLLPGANPTFHDHISLCLSPHLCGPVIHRLHLHLFIFTFHYYLLSAYHFASFGDTIVCKIAWPWPYGIYWLPFITLYCNSLCRSTAPTGQLLF